MAKYRINEYIKTVNVYTLNLNDEFIDELNEELQEEYFNEQGQKIPYINLDTLVDILEYRGDLLFINEDRVEKHKTPLKPFEIKNRNLTQMPNWSLYDIIVDFVTERTWNSSKVENEDSWVDDWYPELDDEKEN